MQSESKAPRWAVFNSIYLLAALTGIYPSLFLVSKNWFLFGGEQSVYLILSLAALSLSVLVTLHSLFSRTSLPSRAARTALVVCAFYLLVGYFDFVIVDLESQYDSFDVRGAIRLVAVTAGAALFIVSWWKPAGRDLVRPFNIGLSIMTSMALFSLLLSVTGNYLRVLAAPPGDVRSAAIYNQVRFRSSPNIYLLIPDSYPSNYVLDRLFQFDNSGFSKELQSRGFRLYEDFFSSYPSSLESVHSMLSMSHNYHQHSLGRDAVGLREVIAGRNNDAVTILTNNDYKSVFIHETDYLFNEQCYIERCMPSLAVYETLWRNLQNHLFFNWLPRSRARYDVVAAMTNQIRNTPENSRTFIYGHFMGAHSGLKSFYVSERSRQAFRKSYPDSIAAINRMLLSQINEISNHDPSAIIIIVGDHGTWAGAHRTESGFTKDETLDKFHVFLAIRWGKGYRGQFDGQIKSGVNLFRYVFAYLGESESILKTRVNDESYLNRDRVYKVVQDGAVMENPVPYKPE
jgi:hypothetical protein